MNKYSSTTESLLSIMQKLRAPGGCPWDRKQTHESLKQYLQEECAELLDAVDERDPKAICEELGDVLMNVIFHAVVAEENNHFTFQDVLREIIDKMIRRHPHVFADAQAHTPDDVKEIWTQVKKTEKQEQPQSILANIPHNLSALATAHTMQKKVAKYGFDWENQAQIIAKIEEELDELKEAIANNDTAEIDAEIGDLIFSVVNLSRYRQEKTAEESLRLTIKKFRNRFTYIEQKLSENNLSLEEASLEKMDSLWEESKKNETKKHSLK